MRKLRVIHGYNNGDIKWCVVCVDNGIRDAPIVSPAYDSVEEAERQRAMLAQPPNRPDLRLIQGAGEAAAETAAPRA